MTSISFKDLVGTITGQFNLLLGRQDAANVRSMALSNEDKAALDGAVTRLQTIADTLATTVTDLPHDALDALLDLDIIKFDFSTAADQTILVGQSGKTLRIHGMVLTAAGATVLTIKNTIRYAGGAGGTIQDLPFIVNGPGAGLPISGRPYFTLPAGATTGDLIINSSAAQRCAGWFYGKVA